MAGLGLYKTGCQIISLGLMEAKSIRGAEETAGHLHIYSSAVHFGA